MKRSARRCAMPRPARIAPAAAPAGSSVIAFFGRNCRSPAKHLLLLTAASVLIGAQWLTGDDDASHGIDASAPSIAPLELMKTIGPLPQTKIADYV